MLGSSDVEERWIEANKVPKHLIEEYEHGLPRSVTVKQAGSNGMNVFTAIVTQESSNIVEHSDESSSKRPHRERWRSPDNSG